MMKGTNMKGSALMRKNMPVLGLKKRWVKQMSKMASRKGPPQDD
jgi:hypothetical protein